MSKSLWEEKAKKEIKTNYEEIEIKYFEILNKMKKKNRTK